MADPLYLRLMMPVHWDRMTQDEQQRVVLEAERQATEGSLRLVKPKPSAVVRLSDGYSLMFDTVPV